MEKLLTIQNQEIPAIGLGTYQLNGNEGQQAIAAAINAGYRHIDTAQFYRNEEIVGNAVRNSGKERKDFFITTKIWPTNFTRKNFIPKVEQSLRELNLQYIDLLLLHWPADDASNDLACDLLNDCISKQYTRLVGVSNFGIPQLSRAQTIMPVFCNQVEYNPYVDQAQMIEYIQAHNLLMTAYTPLARGRVNKDSAFIALAEKYEKSISQVVLRWFIQQKNVSPIPKAGSEKHLIENLDIFDFQITYEDMQTISNLHLSL